MAVLTEAALRAALKGQDLDALGEYRVEEGVIVTPSARAYLTDHRIDLVVGERRVLCNPSGKVTVSEAATGAVRPPLAAKPEHMTSLRGAELVAKDHPVIRFRGMMDALGAQILETQLAMSRRGLARLVDDLGEVLGYVRRMLGCEVKQQPVPPLVLLGLTEEEIHARSHRPKEYYGIGHFAPTLADGEAVIRLNTLRTAVRQTELAAYSAFRGEGGEPTRPDIIRALNRLSSLLYVMMIKTAAKEYEP